MARYGDSPKGMVESAMEFIKICTRHNFHSIVVSMKASNVRIMVQAVRLLAARMLIEGMKYPIHLGVTEAGNGEDGRIKSAVGIGTLLADGIGDTVRVSLHEDPENEIPVAKNLFPTLKNAPPFPKFPAWTPSPTTLIATIAVKPEHAGNIGAEILPL
jgi:(E)-4-hydroxy-3-methylbut-2-enyl-diphosphate synthase